MITQLRSCMVKDVSGHLKMEGSGKDRHTQLMKNGRKGAT